MSLANHRRNSALEHIRSQLPDAEPYRAWQTFTFTTDRGYVREVDLFIATPGGLFLVEIKSHPGAAVNDGSTWLFRDGDKTRAMEHPLHFTDQKAKCGGRRTGSTWRCRASRTTGSSAPRPTATSC